MAPVAYGVLLALVTSFKYLRRVLATEGNYWPAVVRNLKRTRHKWPRLTRILSREGADSRNSGQIYLAVVQFFMLYRSELWVLTPCMKNILSGFHHWVTHRLKGGNHRENKTEVGFTPAGGCDGGSGLVGVGDLHIPPPEHSRTVYCK